MRHIFWLALIFIPNHLFAVTWSVGTAAEKDSAGLSLQRKTDQDNAIQRGCPFPREDRFTVNLDYQRFVYTLLSPYNTNSLIGIYSGLGVKAESRKVEKENEFYSIRMPVGIEYAPRDLYLQLFSDVTGILGELPRTELQFQGRIGARAFF